MANNYTTSSSFTTEKGPSPGVSTSNKSILLDNNLPSASPISEIDDQPPNYFDISIVPNGAILYNNESPPYAEASKAEIERDMKGVLSYDSLIDKNPDQLWLYFMTYLNEKPQLKANICGYYTESYTTTESYTDSDGNTQTRNVEQSRTVTEFNFSIDLSPYICEQWWRVAVIPSTTAINAGEIISLRDAVEQYTRSKRKIKEIVLKKQFHGWNLEDLQSKLMQLVRSTGYNNCISITYSTYNDKITARSSSQLSVFANSTIVRAICCLTCLWIIFAPIYCCLRSLGSTRDKIIAEYVMTQSSDTFLQLNSSIIVNAVISRSSNSYIAYFP